ncbi:MAG: porin, partial [Burkholderiaceae bacterium]|nr:porin [Burkholderiaceae bacterium]
MKKHLIAAAVAAAVAAPAMAQNVTLSGNIDMGVQSYDSSSAGGANDKQFTGVANGMSTSTIAINVNEDLGGGMSVAFQLGNDLAAGANQGGLTAAGQSFLALTQKGIGTIRLGNINTQTLAASGVSQPFATAIGSGFSGNFGRQSYLGVNGTVGAASATAGAVGTEAGQVSAANGTSMSGARVVRANNTLSLETDVFNGFSAVYSMISKNSDPTEVTANNGAEEIAVKYSGMGLNVVAAQYKFLAGASVLAGGGLVANEEVKHTLVGANYALTSNLTLMGGWGNTKSSRAATADSSNRNIAIQYAMTPAVALLANHVRVDDQLVGNRDRALTGLG